MNLAQILNEIPEACWIITSEEGGSLKLTLCTCQYVRYPRMLEIFSIITTGFFYFWDAIRIAIFNLCFIQKVNFLILPFFFCFELSIRCLVFNKSCNKWRIQINALSCDAGSGPYTINSGSYTINSGPIITDLRTNWSSSITSYCGKLNSNILEWH
jgi:hypothetical protein